jgi:O-acetyl-ADP-ribose deacetylase (regulator of RNase III)
MSLNFAKGDLLSMAVDGEFDVIVHGCNIFNTMGAGIAASIKELFPKAYEADCKTIRGDINKLGTYTTAEYEFTIVNAYTQQSFSSSFGLDVFEYTAFELILEKLEIAFYGKRIGLPYIGMGLAKGDSKRIIGMISKFAERHAKSCGTVTLV